MLCLSFPFSEDYQAVDSAARGASDQGTTPIATPTTRITTQKGAQTTQKTRKPPESNQESVEKPATEPLTGPSEPLVGPKTGPKITRNAGPMHAAERILEMLRAEPGITQPVIAERLGLTVKGVKYHFRKLREAGAIRRVGSSRAGHWEVL